MPAPILPNFTETQRQHILGLLPAFTTFLENENPTVQSFHSGTTAWMSKRAAEAIALPAFQSQFLDGRSPSQAQGDIRTFLRNWKNNTYKKSLTLPTPTTGAGDSAPRAVTRKLDDAIRGLVILEGDLSAKELFLRESPESYRTAYATVKASAPSGTPPVVISQKARKLAWDVADHQFWEERKRALETDIARNQELWPQFMRESVQQSLERGIVGSAVAAIMYAYRTESGAVKHGILYAGHNTEAGEEIIHRLPNHNELIQSWVLHSDSELPGVAGRTMRPTFALDQNGLPLLPEINVDDVTVSFRGLVDMLASYLGAMWDHGYPSESLMPSIPWLRIASSPDMHYDTARFQLPCSIGNPAPCSTVDAGVLYEYLLRLQRSGAPFRFYSRSEHKAKVNEATDRFIEEWEANDGVLDEFLEGPEVDTPSSSDPNTRDRAPSPQVLLITSSSTSPVTAPVAKAMEVAPPITDADPVVEPAPHTTPTVPPAVIPTIPSTVSHTSPPPAAGNPLVTPFPPIVEPALKEHLVISPPPPVLDSTTKKNSRKRRKVSDENTPTLLPHQVTRRESTRSRRAATFGVTLVANGQRSPSGRKSSWEMVEAETQSPLPKRRRL